MNSPSHRDYLGRPYHLRRYIYYSDEFSEEKKSLIKKYGNWLEALDKGRIKPETSEQVLFLCLIDAWRGLRETIPLKKRRVNRTDYSNMTEEEQKNIKAEKRKIVEKFAHAWLSYTWVSWQEAEEEGRLQAELEAIEEEKEEAQRLAEGWECRECGGEGWIVDWPHSSTQFTCPVCGGSGRR